MASASTLSIPAAPIPTATPISSGRKRQRAARASRPSPPKKPKRPASAAWASRRTSPRWRFSFARPPPATFRVWRSPSMAAPQRACIDRIETSTDCRPLMTSGAPQTLQSTGPAASESEPAPSCPAHRQPVRYIDLHRSPNRHDYFAHATRGIAFDAALGRWIIDDPELITKVLTDPGFSTSDYAGVCRHMAEAGQPVANLAFAYENIPLCHD